MKPSLRIVIVAPDSLAAEDPTEDNAEAQAERSRSLRIGLLENGYNPVAANAHINSSDNPGDV